MLLVGLAKSFEDLDRICDRRFVHLNRLESAFKRRVLFEMFAVLLERGCTDGLQFTAGKHRFEDAGSVDGALSRTRTDKRVDLVYEQDDIATGADLLEYLLESFLEITAIARTGNECAEVQCVDVLIGECVWHGAVNDLASKSLDDGSLAHTRLPDEHWVVLRAPREHLHHALDLVCAADDRVEFLFTGKLGEVAPELVEHRRTG